MSGSGSHTPLRWLADEGSMEVFVEQRRGRGSMSESGGNAAPLPYLLLATKLSRVPLFASSTTLHEEDDDDG